MRLSALILASALSVLCHAQTWHPVAGGAASTVYSLEPFAGDLFAGGLFTTIDGQPAQYLARWDGSAWHPVANLVTFMAADGLHANDTALFIGDGGRVRFWNGSNLYNLTGVSSSSFNSTVYAIAHFQDTLYCGGFFSSPFARIAKWNGTAYESVTSGCNAQVSFLTPFQDQLFVGGNFQLAGDSLVNHTALWDGEAWHAMGAGVNNDVFAHCFFQDTLYIGGRFTSANGQVASRVAKWNGSQWVRVGGTLNDYVTAMTVYRDQLYIGGAFTTPNHIARLNGTSWVPVGSGCNERVRTMEVYHDTLFVGGDFTQAGGIDASRIAKWHLPQPPVATIEVDDGTLCVNDCSIFSDLSPNGVATRLWEFPGGTPATSTDSVVTVCYDEPGTYAATLTVSNAGGMDASTLLDAVVVEICTAVAETARTGSLSLWPNPTHGTLSVQWEHDTPMRATLLNATGRTLGNYLLQPGANMIDLRGIAPGGYLLRTVDGGSLRVMVME
ncbi:MAG: PKD domain-containing protein [Flavobacteriales bacterium]|nr:PKD domain-containing protein [Flavobacteriales bacterium]